MSQLVSMPEDVTLLAKREIIVHHLDSDEMVSDLFTMLSKDIVSDFNSQYYLKTLCQMMETYYQSRLNGWVAWLWLNHFSDLWLVLGAFATVLVLLCPQPTVTPLPKSPPSPQPAVPPPPKSPLPPQPTITLPPKSPRPRRLLEARGFAAALLLAKARRRR